MSPYPPSEECRRTKKGCPRGGSREDFSGKIAPPQIPFNSLSYYRNRGVPVRWGRSPREHALPEKSSQHHPPRISHLPMVKTIKTTASYLPDTFPSLPGTQGRQIPDVFPKKPGRFFPIRNPLYFSVISSFQAIPAFRMTSCSSPFSRSKERG